MSALLILLIAIVVLALGYVFYGSWLAKQWGVDPNRETPAHTAYDGKDFVPANPAVLMGHHFSSIAGAGPINGPIQAAVFGSIGQIMKDSMGVKAQRLFIVFALAVLILVIASFTSVVAGTFASGFDKESGARLLPVFTAGDAVTAQGATAMTSMLFILIAIIFGFFVYRKNAKIGPATVIGIIGIIAIVFIGLNVGLNFNRTFWVLFIAIYVTIASLLPVWILLQPRDYLSSFLLYGMMILAVVSIVGATFTGAATMEVPAFTGWKNPSGQPLFPFLFITVACGACSGFHSLISSGTSSKQINNEKDAQIIGYGSMIVESALGVISLIAIGVVYNKVMAGDDVMKMSAPPTIFAGGIATMFSSFAGKASFKVIQNLFTLAVSVFALTSLDSATRLCRYLFAELLTPEGKTHEDLTGAAKFFSTPIVSTLIMVVIGCGMGFLELKQIWGVFGAANQLLAGIAMLAVCTWLGKIGRNNKMFYFPMVFMLCATITAFQVIWSIILVVLAIDLAIMAFKTLAAQAKAKKA